MFIIPVLLKTIVIMEEVVMGEVTQNSTVQTKLVVVGIVFTVLFSLYLFLFPLRRIQQEITTTHAMIALMPPDPEATPKPISN